MATDVDKSIRETIREIVTIAERLDPELTPSVSFRPIDDGPERDWGNRWLATLTWSDGRRCRELGDCEATTIAEAAEKLLVAVMRAREEAAE